jgi:hypothetical protein
MYFIDIQKGGRYSQEELRYEVARVGVRFQAEFQLRSSLPLSDYTSCPPSINDRTVLPTQPKKPKTMMLASLSKNVVRPTAVAARVIGGARGYHEKVIQHYEKPRNVRLMALDFLGLYSMVTDDATFILIVIAGWIDAEN